MSKKRMNGSAPAGSEPTSNKAKVVLDAFDKALKIFSSAMKTGMGSARTAAELALKHFQEHGDVSKCQRLLDAMPKDFARRSAYLLWLRDHSPITMVEGKLAKDKSDNATEFNVEAACAKPFWEYAPEREQVAFGADDVVVAMERAVKRFENSKKFKAADENATAKLNLAKASIAALKAA